MIARIEKVRTKLSIIHNIPKKFFSEIEGSTTFGDHLFPPWANTIYATTDLKNKFEVVYNKYKSIRTKANRDIIVNAFIQNSKIEELCGNHPVALMITIEDLPVSIRPSIDKLFLYLYNTAINYHGFQTFVKDTLRETIDRFIVKNGLVVCPFCGLESFTNIEGQARLPLDHWLCKDLFPMTSVNFNNLVPIGKDCNQRPAKGDKNILIDDPTTNNRVIAYYPYYEHQGISPNFSFVNEPNGSEIVDTDWIFTFAANNIAESDIFRSWSNTMNIRPRYLDYFRKNIFQMWENDYKDHINDPDNTLVHAQTIEELKNNFRQWKSTFKIKARPGSVLYRSFIDFLINQASDGYLTGLCANLKR